MSHTRIVVPSQTFKAQLERFELPFSKPLVIHNGIDTDIFYPTLNNENRHSLCNALHLSKDDKPTFAYISNRLDNPQKGFRYLLEACENIDRPIRLVVIGHYSKEIEQLKTFGPIETIFTGYIQDKKVLADWLRVSDFFINTSLYETFGLTNLEGLSCGAIPIIFDLPIFRETLAQFGRFAEEISGAALYQLMEAAIDTLADPVVIKKAHRYVQENFSLRQMNEAYQSLYHEAVD